LLKFSRAFYDIDSSIHQNDKATDIDAHVMEQQRLLLAKNIDCADDNTKWEHNCAK